MGTGAAKMGGKSIPRDALRGCVAVVSGATRGIGRGIAIGLGEAGATVYITGRTQRAPGAAPKKDERTLQATQEAVEKVGGTCIPVAVDHAKTEEVEAFFQRVVREQNGRLDFVINCAYSGVSAIKEVIEKKKPFYRMPLSHFHAINHVGLEQQFVACQLAARAMLGELQSDSETMDSNKDSGKDGSSKRATKCIINVSSFGGLQRIFDIPYGAGKAATDRMTADMDVELAPHGVRVFALWPGVVATEAMVDAFEKMGMTGDESAPHGIANGETPLYVGRAVASICWRTHSGADSRSRQDALGGHVRVVAEHNRRHGITDEHGRAPVSLRSLRFILYSVLGSRASLVPDWRVPWFVVKAVAKTSPQFSWE